MEVRLRLLGWDDENSFEFSTKSRTQLRILLVFRVSCCMSSAMSERTFLAWVCDRLDQLSCCCSRDGSVLTSPIAKGWLTTCCSLGRRISDGSWEGQSLVLNMRIDPMILAWLEDSTGSGICAILTAWFVLYFLSLSKERAKSLVGVIPLCAWSGGSRSCNLASILALLRNLYVVILLDGSSKITEC